MNYLKYWDSDKRSHNAPHSAKIMDIRLTSNERHLVVASKDKTITLWDFVCNSFLRRLVGHEDEVSVNDFSIVLRFIHKNPEPVVSSSPRTIYISSAVSVQLPLSLMIPPYCLVSGRR